MRVHGACSRVHAWPATASGRRTVTGMADTTSGKWGYLEHDWVATAGDFVYESPGEGHTLVAYEHPEPMKVHFNVTGPLIWIDENGESVGQFDVFDYIKLCQEHYAKNGI